MRRLRTFLALKVQDCVCVRVFVFGLGGQGRKGEKEKRGIG